MLNATARCGLTAPVQVPQDGTVGHRAGRVRLRRQPPARAAAGELQPDQGGDQPVELFNAAGGELPRRVRDDWAQ